MDTDAIVGEVDALNAKNSKDKKIKRKIVISENVWREISDRADELEMSDGSYIELACNFLCDEESTLAQYQRMLTDCKATIEDYRRRLKDAGVKNIDSF